jgi:pilus assembly protein Flp/PilA
MNSFQRFVRDTRGANMVEYLIICGVVALLAYGGFNIFGTQVRTTITTQGNSLQQVPQGVVP